MTTTTTQPATPLMSTAEAAAYLGIAALTLKKWRRKHKGPVSLRLGHRTVRYRKESLEAWLAAPEVAAPSAS